MGHTGRYLSVNCRFIPNTLYIVILGDEVRFKMVVHSQGCLVITSQADSVLSDYRDSSLYKDEVANQSWEARAPVWSEGHAVPLGVGVLAAQRGGRCDAQGLS